MYEDLPSEVIPYLDSSAQTTGALTGVLLALAIVGVIIVVALLVLVIVANCKMFKKAGEAWWKALVPLYNSWVEARIGGLAWWWFLIFVVVLGLMGSLKETNPVVSMLCVLTSYNYSYNICKKFGKSGGFALLCTFLPFVGLPILAFGIAKYDKSISTDENGIFSIK